MESKDSTDCNSPTPSSTHVVMDSPCSDAEQESNKSISNIADYRDFSLVPPPEEDVGDQKRSKEPSFPMKLHMILSNPDFEHVICWLPHGRSWKILDFRDFEELIIPQFFRHGRYSSFARQVNGWGFTRVAQGPDSGSYYHEKFLRGLPHVCHLMRRKDRRDSVNHKETDSDDKEVVAPDFYEISAKNPLPENRRRSSLVPPRSAPQLTVAAAAARGSQSHDSIMAHLQASLVDREHRIKVLKQLSIAQEQERMNAEAANNSLRAAQQMRAADVLPSLELLLRSQGLPQASTSRKIGTRFHPAQQQQQQQHHHHHQQQHQQQLLDAGVSLSLLGSRQEMARLHQAASASANLHAAPGGYMQKQREHPHSGAPMIALSDLTALLMSQAIRQAAVAEEAARATAQQQQLQQQQQRASLLGSHVASRRQWTFEEAAIALGIVQHPSLAADDDKLVSLLRSQTATQHSVPPTNTASFAGSQQQRSSFAGSQEQRSSFDKLVSLLRSQASQQNVLPTNNASFAGSSAGGQSSLDKNQLMTLLLLHRHRSSTTPRDDRPRNNTSIIAAQQLRDAAAFHRHQQQQQMRSRRASSSSSSGGSGPLKKRAAAPHQSSSTDPTTAAILQALEHQQQQHDMLTALLKNKQHTTNARGA